MKKIVFVAVMLLGFAATISAQKQRVPVRRVIVPYYTPYPTFYYNAPYYSPFYNPYMSYRGFYDPFFMQTRNTRPTKLDLEIQDINHAYSKRIADVRRDKTLPKAERKSMIRALRHEREAEIIDARKAFYKD